jgi:hypothetical protein
MSGLSLRTLSKSLPAGTNFGARLTTFIGAGMVPKNASLSEMTHEQA